MAEAPIATTYVESALDPEPLVSMFYSDDTISQKYTAWVFDQMHSAFKNGSLRGRKILEVGTGAVIHLIIPASKWFDEVYLSDISKPCLAKLEQWRRGESDHMRPLMQLFALKDDTGVAWETMNTQILQKIKGILEFDVNQPSHCDEVLNNAPYDVITSTFCLAGANFTVQDFTKALYNISNLLMPGGCLVVCDAVDHSFFICGKFKFLHFSSTTEELQNAYKAAGFIIDTWNSYSLGEMHPNHDTSTVYFTVARKPLIN